MSGQYKGVGRSVGLTTTGIRTWVARMVAQWLTHHATVAYSLTIKHTTHPSSPLKVEGTGMIQMTFGTSYESLMYVQFSSCVHWFVRVTL